MHIHAKYYSQQLRILPALSGLIGKSHTDGSQRATRMVHKEPHGWFTKMHKIVTTEGDCVQFTGN